MRQYPFDYYFSIAITFRSHFRDGFRLWNAATIGDQGGMTTLAGMLRAIAVNMGLPRGLQRPPWVSQSSPAVARGCM